MHTPAIDKSKLQNLAQHLPHLLIVVAPSYEWGMQIASSLATTAQATSETIYPVKTIANKEEVNLEAGRINVAQARQLVGGITTISPQKRAFILYKADSMTHQAQNALLKSFEEPNNNIHFILVVTSMERLLPTVISRAVKLPVAPLKEASMQALLPTSLTKQEVQQILFVAGGDPSLALRLANNKEELALYANNIKVAKTFLQASAYQKIAIINKFNKDKTGALQFLAAIINILKRTIKSNDNTSLQLLQAAIQAHEDIEANINIRLALLRNLSN